MSTSTAEGSEPADTAASSAPSRAKPTSFEHLPAELRNSIYELAGCGKYYEEPVSSHFRHSVEGDYTVEHHHKAHGCKDRASCSNAPWDDFRSWSPAAIMVNPARDSTTRVNGFLPWPRTCKSDRWRRPLRCYEATTDQPAITRVSRVVRGDTLSIFYGGHPFIFRLISTDGSDKDKILQYLDTIGLVNASRLEEVYIVYARKQQEKEIEKDLLREMKVRGVITGGMDKLGVVRLTRLGYPFSQTDSGVLDAVTRARGLNY
ncbi:hypothetical protein CB0940_08480 [Cercospora beticola]|uniref:Uncharacterized protein n=1 Tax=Cercospora beticola TaxID=122368 RepID=A0A2G5HR66_CERBT|nr:hypothetical protein CB0940_08480 [Cercospora beticola]PIA95024.1 hypothetical protein CB0940_08480 [Cercospora beticola]WPB05054.1 hypothetical protein RHO25_009703 [Cercospora beticola]